ncbi:MAG TPA: TldD/PmbA family protein, partial [Lachnospiraceae bacterium]|nr:TldD/PmbA family protein [Lachnospiraceae bacterium]
ALVQGNLVNNSREEQSGVSARVYRNGVYGFSSAAMLTEEKAEAVLRAATDNALFMDKRIQKGKGAIPRMEESYFSINKMIEDLEQKQAIELCQEVDRYVVSKCSGITSRTIVYNEDSTEKIIYTSDGHSGHVTCPRSYVYVIMSAEANNGSPIELFKAFGGYGSFRDNFSDISGMYEIIDKLYEDLMRKKEGVYPEAGNKQVILGGFLTGMLAHEAVGHTVEADLVKGGSVAGPALHQIVASEKVNLVDFAHTALGKQAPLPVYLDDEGVLAEDQVLIKAGKLVGYMNNRESGIDFGMKPNGNARAWMFSDEPLIRMRNTAILPGTDKLEEMIASVDDGYYLIDTNNGQADLTGEFMFGICMGYEIKKGKLARPILDTTVTGVAFEMLKTVDMVGDELVWTSAGACGKKQMMPVGMGGPAIRCKITIGGR